MELKTFIKQTLLDIAGAIKEVNEDASTNMVVNPTKLIGTRGTQVDVLTTSGAPLLQSIKFDVAVTVGSSAQEGESSRIDIASAKVNTSGESLNTQEQISRIQFEVPVALPTKQNR